jgi:hypothetical protein
MGYPSLTVAQSVYNPGRQTNDTAPRIEQSVFDVRLYWDTAGRESVAADLVDGESVDGEVTDVGDLVLLVNDAAFNGVVQIGDTAGTFYKDISVLYAEGYRIIRVYTGDTHGTKLYQIQADTYELEEVGTIPTNPLTDIGRIHFAIVCNLGNDNLWIQFFDTASTPEDGEVPHISVLAQPSSYATLDFGAAGRPLRSGSFYICASTSAATKTLDDTDSCLFDITYSK